MSALWGKKKSHLCPPRLSSQSYPNPSCGWACHSSYLWHRHTVAAIRHQMFECYGLSIYLFVLRYLRHDGSKQSISFFFFFFFFSFFFFLHFVLTTTRARFLVRSEPVLIDFFVFVFLFCFAFRSHHYARMVSGAKRTRAVAEAAAADASAAAAAAAFLASAGSRGTLSNRLNPTHTDFDPAFAAAFRALPRRARATVAAADAAASSASMPPIANPAALAFVAEAADHAESPVEAYTDISPVLHALATARGVLPAALRVYDPYYCNGAVVRHLGALGFVSVRNVNEDFYAAAAANAMPPMDVLLTNPAYSGDHIPRLLAICSALRGSTPLLLLLPAYVLHKPYWRGCAAALAGRELLLLYPRRRYCYWTPRGLRPREALQSHSGPQGNRTSPWPSLWVAFLAPADTAAVRAALAAQQAPAALTVANAVSDLPRAFGGGR